MLEKMATSYVDLEREDIFLIFLLLGIKAAMNTAGSKESLPLFGVHFANIPKQFCYKISRIINLIARRYVRGTNSVQLC